MSVRLQANRSFDTDTPRQGAAGRMLTSTLRGALPGRAGQLQRWPQITRHF